MKKLAAISCAFFISACAVGPSYEAAKISEFRQANYDATDNLIASTSMPVDKSTPILVATIVTIDNLNKSSQFGRLVSEQVASRLTQLGFNVVEMKLRNNVYIQESAGELLLSRDVRNLSKSYNVQVVVVGNYAVASDHIYLTLKAVTVADNRVISAINYLMPLSANNREMLR